MSHIGEQLVVQKTVRPLEKDRNYHFLGRFGSLSNAVLVHFDEKPGAYLTVMKGYEFEAAIESESIVDAPVQATVPPWLKRLEGLKLPQAEKKRRKPKKDSQSRVDKSLSRIMPVLNRIEEILGSEDPEFELNRAARECRPALNESRCRRQVLAYLAFGRNKWALLPAFCNTGHAKSLEQRTATAAGCPSVADSRAARRKAREEMRKRNIKGYEEFAKQSKFMHSIWSRTLTKAFGCRTNTLANGREAFYHPSGEAFPSYWQFYRDVVATVGLVAVQTKRYGASRVRHKRASSKGKYSEPVANLLERIDGDAYYLKEVPEGPEDGEPMPPLCVVRLRCRASGMLVGIGFAVGKEQANAYRMALFCMAISKVKFCRLFGETISAEDWPCEGLPSWATFDRGPGSAKDLITEFEHRIPMRELTPSWDGQGNANIEASHPRDVKIDGKPTYVKSKLNYVELARREIRRLILDNRRIQVMPRMTPAMVKARILSAPIGVWGYLDKYKRTDAHPIPFDKAVRCLTTKVGFTTEGDGVYLEGQRFDSDALRLDDQYERVVAGDGVSLPGYALDFVVRHAWVELEGRLLEVDAKLPIRDHEGQLFVSLSDLSEIDQIRGELRAGFPEHRAAAGEKACDEFEEGTGKDWDAGQRKAGRPKRGTPAARQEFSDVRQILARKQRKA